MTRRTFSLRCNQSRKWVWIFRFPVKRLRFRQLEAAATKIQVLGSSSTSYQFQLVATNSPLILQPPRNVTVSSNASTLFTVVAEGCRPLSYQWQFAGKYLTGQKAPMLALTNIDGSQAGSYWVIVSNSGGAVTSAPAVLAVSSSNVQPSLAAASIRPGQFLFVLTGEIGRNYRIESSSGLAGWTNEYSFPRTPYYFDLPGYTHDNPVLTSIVFNTNDSSIFVMSNDATCNFLRASRYQPANEICINNLRQIRFAKLLWRRDKAGFLQNRGDTPIGRDLAPYFPQGALPHCPMDPEAMFPTSYNPKNCESTPGCEINASHVLEEPQ